MGPCARAFDSRAGRAWRARLERGVLARRQTLASGIEAASVRLWNAGDCRERARLAGHVGRVWSVAFSPDGQTLASGGEDGSVRLWSAGDGREHARLAGHGGRVVSVAFSPDGQTLAS